MLPSAHSLNSRTPEHMADFWNKLTIKQKLAITAWLFLAVPLVFYITIRFYPTFEAFTSQR
jgi:multiple sugar transport system permease protein